MKYWISGAGLALALALASTAAASDVGRRFPSERRSIVDARTGVTVTALTTSPAADVKVYQTHPQWTPDGRALVFISDRAGGGDQAFAISEETGEIVQLTDEPGFQAGRMALARKAERLYLFRRDQLVEVDLAPILRGRAGDAASRERRIATVPEVGRKSVLGFGIDADDRRAYVSYRLDDERCGLYRIDLITGAKAEVVVNPFKIGHVQPNPWNPEEILYCHETGGDAPQRMWLVRADGTGNRPVYEESPVEWVTHEVFADRDHVLFILAGGTPRARTRATGMGLVSLRDAGMSLIGQDPGRGFWHCAITPDLKWAVGDTMNGDLYRIDVATGERTLLTAGHRGGEKAAHAHQNINPDGRRVLFGSSLLGNSDLMTVPLHPEGRPR